MIINSKMYNLVADLIFLCMMSAPISHTCDETTITQNVLLLSGITIAGYIGNMMIKSIMIKHN